jgi:hypothetical protein
VSKRTPERTPERTPRLDTRPTLEPFYRGPIPQGYEQFLNNDDENHTIRDRQANFHTRPMEMPIEKPKQHYTKPILYGRNTQLPAQPTTQLSTQLPTQLPAQLPTQPTTQFPTQLPSRPTQKHTRVGPASSPSASRDTVIYRESSEPVNWILVALLIGFGILFLALLVSS